MTTLVHVGFAKTGTSLLQQRVFSDRAAGFHRCLADAGAAMEAFVLSHPAAFDPDRVRAHVDRECAAAPAGAVRVISHEGLSGNALRDWRATHHVPARIRAAFPQARILICIREQKDLLLSLYNQNVRAGLTAPLEAYVRHGGPGFRSVCAFENYRFDHMIDQYVAEFGRDNVLVLPFESLKTDPAGFIGRIYAFAGVAATPPARLPRDNSSVGAVGLGLIRRLNHVVRRPPAEERVQKSSDRHRLMVAAMRRLDRLAPAAANRRASARMRALLAERLAGYYAESNRRVQAETGLALDALGYET